MKTTLKKDSSVQLLKIATYPDPILVKISKPVGEITDQIQELAVKMIKTMYEAPGMGLAAVQVGVLKRLIVIDSFNGDEETEGEPIVLINPRIIETKGMEVNEEGCLSLPKLYIDLPRPSGIKAAFTNLLGQSEQIELEGTVARCFAHEMDHLDGILLWDHFGVWRRAWLKAIYYRRFGFAR